MKVFLDTSFFVDFFRGKREAKKVFEKIYGFLLFYIKVEG